MSRSVQTMEAQFPMTLEEQPSVLAAGLFGPVAVAGETTELDWHRRALCAQTDPEAFFPERGVSTSEAKKVCMTCDVRSECLEDALKNDVRFGVLGGLTDRERRKLKRRLG